jgi:hypothetical protein
MAWLALVLLNTVPIVFVQGLCTELPSITLLFLHFELLVGVLLITQSMESGGWYKFCYRFSIELILDFCDEWESHTTLLPISLYDEVTRKGEKGWKRLHEIQTESLDIFSLKFTVNFYYNANNSRNSIKRTYIENNRCKEKMKIKMKELKLNEEKEKKIANQQIVQCKIDFIA